MPKTDLLIGSHWSPTCCSHCLWSTSPAKSTHSQTFPSARTLPSTARAWFRRRPHFLDAALAMTAPSSLVYHYTTNCQPTQRPFSVRSPMQQVTAQCCIDVHPACASMSHDRSVQGKCFRKARQSKVQLFFFGD